MFNSDWETAIQSKITLPFLIVSHSLPQILFREYIFTHIHQGKPIYLSKFSLIVSSCREPLPQNCLLPSFVTTLWLLGLITMHVTLLLYSYLYVQLFLWVTKHFSSYHLFSFYCVRGSAPFTLDVHEVDVVYFRFTIFRNITQRPNMVSRKGRTVTVCQIPKI